MRAGKEYKMNLDLKIVLPVVIAFCISVVLCPIVIPFLKKLKFGQFVRDDGPQAHLKKAGTPTMGGLIILLSLTITTLIYIVVTGVFAYYVEKYSDINNELIIPFLGKTVQLNSTLYVILLFFIVLGTVNGANFTDGLDGLASSVTVLIATFFAVVAVGTDSGVAPVACAAVGCLLGFLVYNVYPAKVFMGDTGSLALGGFVASTAYMLKMPIFIVIIAFIYFIEVLSVIIQVVSFKLTGKRVFRMAPIHHHFELGGWPESKVVAIFSIVTAVLCVVGLLAL